MTNILWLEPPNLSDPIRRIAQRSLSSAGIKPFDVTYKCITQGMLIKKTKTKWIADPERAQEFHSKLSMLNPTLVVVNDKAALNYISEKYTSLALCRGSVYPYELEDGTIVPCIVVNELRQTKFVKGASWVLLQDLKKVNRWWTGNLRPAAKFAYTVCKDRNDLQTFKNFAASAVLMGIDIETSIGHISCSGYTCVRLDGKIHTYVVPFIDPTKPGGCYWESAEDEIFAWQVLKFVHATDAYKGMQNGSYDSAYFHSRRIPLKNYLCDTQHMWHSIYVELPKRLDFITSLCYDLCQFWKDEGKEDAKTDKEKTKIPKSEAGMIKYWRYNALDCHNTTMDLLYLAKLLAHPKFDWALKNFVEEFQQQFGPAFRMTMTGIKLNTKIHRAISTELIETAYAYSDKLTIMANDYEYSHTKPLDTASLLYDVFKLTPYRKAGRTTDEKALKMIMDQNPFASYFVDTLWKAKKAANNVSKYGEVQKLGRNGRVLYKMGAGITDTSRYSSPAHDFWCGVNIQNMPYIMRPMMEADTDYVLVDIDYAQSDAYFTAYDMADEKLIATMESDKDTHCYHCAYFFKKDYDELIKAHKKKEDWVSHNVTGVRSITKRVVYGANYLMAGATLFQTMGRAAVKAAAVALGYKDALSWSDKKLIKLCTAFLASYFKLYDTLSQALHDKIDKAVKNGNRASTIWGFTRIFFGDLKKDNALQRQFAAFFGQGGSAGNINLALKNMFYKPCEQFFESSRMSESYKAAADSFIHTTNPENTLQRMGQTPLADVGVIMLFQVHDSFIFQVHKSQLFLIDFVLEAMENTCEAHGRKFKVPVEADIGLGWGKRLMPYKSGVTYEEIKQHDDKWMKKFFGK